MPALRLIIGPAGSGKSSLVIDEAARAALASPLDGPPLLVVVPEQQAMMTERALLARMIELSSSDRAANSRLRVMSLSRLGNWLAERAGIRRTRLSRLGQRLLVWQLLEGEPQREARAEVFSELLVELAHYGVRPAMLQARAALLAGSAETARQQLADKLRELAELQERYIARCDEGKLAFEPPASLIPRLLNATNWPQPGETRVWLDGFAGFTPEEQKACTALLKHCESLTATVLIDPQRIAAPLDQDIADWYQPTRELLSCWQRIAADNAVRPVVVELDVLRRWDYGSSLKRLAINGPQGFGAEAVPAAPDEALALTCRNAREEAQMAALEALRLAEQQGLRFGSISVVTRSLAGSSDLLKSAFAELNIPCFIDSRRSLMHHPAVELLRCGLRLALGSGTLDDLFTYLKSDLLPYPEEGDGATALELQERWRGRVDELENYALAHGLYVANWLAAEDWQFHKLLLAAENREDSHGPAPSEVTAWLSVLDDWRRTAMRPIMQLASRLKALPDSERSIAAIMRLAWEELFERAETGGHLQQRLEDWAERSDTAEPELSESHRRVLGKLAELLDELCAIAGEEVMGADELSRWLEFGLAALDLGYAPQRLDSVLITDIERGRHHNVEAALLIGLAEDSWPPHHGEAPYLSDHERELINAGDPLLSGGSSEAALREPYLALVAATRPSKYLYISRPAADSEGRERPPSPYFSGICEALGIKPQHAPALPEAEAARVIASPGVLAREAALLPSGNALEAVAREFAAGSAELQSLERVRSEATAGGYLAPLPPERVAALLRVADGRLLLECSASRLESFANCPFKHFMSYYLKLRERDEAEFDNLELGNFYHRVLEQLASIVNRGGRDWADLEDSELEDAARQALSDIAPRLRRETARQHVEYILSRAELLMTRHARELGQRARATGLRPYQTELSFGDTRRGDSLPPIVIEHSMGSIHIRGLIDRLDRDPAGNAAVVDYKLSRRSVDWAQFLAGAQIQLMVYLLALQNWQRAGGSALTPASAEYQGIEPYWYNDEARISPSVVPPAGSEAGNILGRLLGETERICGELAAAILAGEISPRPLRDSKGRWLPGIDSAYRAVSRFDPLNDTRGRSLSGAGNKALLTAISDGTDFSGSADPRQGRSANRGGGA